MEKRGRTTYNDVSLQQSKLQYVRTVSLVCSRSAIKTAGPVS